jgi:hypothetical protein
MMAQQDINYGTETMRKLNDDWAMEMSEEMNR